MQKFVVVVDRLPLEKVSHHLQLMLEGPFGSIGLNDTDPVEVVHAQFVRTKPNRSLQTSPLGAKWKYLQHK